MVGEATHTPWPLDGEPGVGSSERSLFAAAEAGEVEAVQRLLQAKARPLLDRVQYRNCLHGLNPFAPPHPTKLFGQLPKQLMDLICHFLENNLRQMLFSY